MKDMKRPDFMRKAAASSRGHMAFLEILIAFLVFIVSSFVMGIIQIPLMVCYLLSDEQYVELLLQGDAASFQQAMEIATQIPEWLMIVVLMSEILMIAVILLYCRFLEKRTPDTLGFRKKGWIRQYLFGALGGIGFFSVAYLLCVITGSIHWDGVADAILPLYMVGYLIGYMIQGMAEEVLCRGYLFVSLTRRYSVFYAMIISAVFFALLHGMNSNLTVLAMINLFLFGVFAALLLLQCENIWIVGAFHSMWNFAQGNLYGISVSGNRLQQSIFASTSTEGMSLLHGGAFGMEGGLAVTIVLAAGIAWLLWLLKKEGKIVEQPVALPFEQAGTAGSAGDVMRGETVSFGEGETRTEPQKRENMGIRPGETPWHPDSAAQQAVQEPDHQQTEFNADYFKD